MNETRSEGDIMNEERVSAAVSALVALAHESKTKHDQILAGLSEEEADMALRTVTAVLLPMVQDFVGRAMSAGGRDD